MRLYSCVTNILVAVSAHALPYSSRGQITHGLCINTA